MSDHRDLDLDAQLQSFATTLEVDAGESIRPGPRRPGDDADDRELEPFDLTPSVDDRRNWLRPAVAAAAVIVIVVAGLVALSADDAPSDGPAPVQTVEPSPESPVPPEPTVEPEPSVEPESNVTPEPTVASTPSMPSDQTSQDPTELSPPESGETQRTIIGDITWTYLESDSSTQPPMVNVEIDGEFFGFEGDGRTWRSSDGITWELLDLPPIGVLSVFEFDAGTWARTFSEDGVGFARWDGSSFVPVDLPPSLAPDVDGLEASQGFPADPVEFGDGLVISRTTQLAVPWNELFSRQVFPEWDEVTQTLRLRDPESDDPLPVAVLTAELVQGEPGSVEFRDAETAELVTTVGLIPGVDPDETLRRLVIGHGFGFGELLIGGRDGFEAVEAPRRFANNVRVAALDGGLLSVVSSSRFEDNRFSTTEWELWTSVDARTWTQLELPIPFGSQTDSIQIVSDGSLALLTIVSSEGSIQRPETWSTIDGTSWEPMEDDGGFDGTEFTDFGWFRGRVFEGGGISVSPDGLVWQEIPIVLAVPGGPGAAGVSVHGRTIFITTNENGGERKMWVGRVADN